jgi:hypothetical protein
VRCGLALCPLPLGGGAGRGSFRCSCLSVAPAGWLSCQGLTLLAHKLRLKLPLLLPLLLLLLLSLLLSLLLLLLLLLLCPRKCAQSSAAHSH